MGLDTKIIDSSDEEVVRVNWELGERQGMDAILNCASVGFVYQCPLRAFAAPQWMLVMESHLFVRRRGSRYACPLDWKPGLASSMPYVLELWVPGPGDWIDKLGLVVHDSP